MKSYTACFAIILAAYFISVIIPVNANATITGFIFTALLIQGTANTILHFAFCRSGKVAPFALPLMWVSCILPLYVYCFSAMTSSGFFGPDFIFVAIGLFSLAPALAISIFTCVIFYIAERFRK